MTREKTIEGESKELVVFFSDIHGFTSFSAGLESKRVFELLQDYFVAVQAVLKSCGAVIDKITDSTITAFWGTPRSAGDDAQNAVMACLKMRTALSALNEARFAHGEKPLMIGMALHLGCVITTERVEAATKSFGTDLLVSEEICARLGGLFKFEMAGAVSVKGRSEPLQLFKVLAYQNAVGDFIEVRTPYSDYQAERDDKMKIKPPA